MTATHQPEVVARWTRRQSRCLECGTVHSDFACPRCGQHPDAAPVGMVASVAPTPDGGARLTLVEVDGVAGPVERHSRTITAEQVHWLRRQTTPPATTTGVAE